MRFSLRPALQPPRPQQRQSGRRFGRKGGLYLSADPCGRELQLRAEGFVEL